MLNYQLNPNLTVKMSYFVFLCLDIVLTCLMTYYHKVILEGVKYSPLYVFTKGLSSGLYLGDRLDSVLELSFFPRSGLVINSRVNSTRVSLPVPAAGTAPDCRIGLSYLKPNKIYLVRIRSLPISKSGTI